MGLLELLKLFIIGKLPFSHSPSDTHWLYLMEDADEKPPRCHWGDITFKISSTSRQCEFSKGRDNYQTGNREDYGA